MCFEENSKWWKINLEANGCGFMGRCIMTQGIQGKIFFDFTTYGSRVIGQNVKWAVIAPP